MKKEYFTYSSRQELRPHPDRAYHNGDSSDIYDEPQPRSVSNYFIEGFVGRKGDDQMLAARRRFRVSVEEVVYERERDGYIAVLQEDNSRVGGGETQRAAIEDLKQNLVIDYDFYVSSSDEQLTGDAQTYKRLLQDLMQEV